MNFLSSDNPADIIRVTTLFPEFKQAYQEINDFRKNPKKPMAMVSGVVNIMDQNAVKSMVEEMQGELAEKDEALVEEEVIIVEKNEKLQEWRQY